LETPSKLLAGADEGGPMTHTKAERIATQRRERSNQIQKAEGGESRLVIQKKKTKSNKDLIHLSNTRGRKTTEKAEHANCRMMVQGTEQNRSLVNSHFTTSGESLSGDRARSLESRGAGCTRKHGAQAFSGENARKWDSPDPRRFKSRG